MINIYNTYKYQHFILSYSQLLQIWSCMFTIFTTLANTNKFSMYMMWKMALIPLEGLVNMEDNENAEFKIFHCMQLLHHAYNHSFCQGYNHMHIHNQTCIKNIIHFNISTTSSIQVEDLITKRKCNTYITPKLVARSKCFRLLLIH